MNYMPLLAFNNDWSHPRKEQINYKCCLEIVKHYYVLAGFGPKSSSIGLILKVIDSSEKVWLNLNLDKERTLEDHKNWKNQPCTQNRRHYKLTHFAGDSAQKCSLYDHPLSPISDTELQRGVESQWSSNFKNKQFESSELLPRLAERSFDSARSSLTSFTFTSNLLCSHQECEQKSISTTLGKQLPQFHREKGKLHRC